MKRFKNEDLKANDMLDLFKIYIRSGHKELFNDACEEDWNKVEDWIRNSTEENYVQSRKGRNVR